MSKRYGRFNGGISKIFTKEEDVEKISTLADEYKDKSEERKFSLR